MQRVKYKHIAILMILILFLSITCTNNPTPIYADESAKTNTTASESTSSPATVQGQVYNSGDTGTTATNSNADSTSPGTSQGTSAALDTSTDTATDDTLTGDRPDPFSLYGSTPLILTEEPVAYTVYNSVTNTVYGSNSITNSKASGTTLKATLTSTSTSVTNGTNLQNFLNHIVGRRSITQSDKAELADRYNGEETIDPQTGALTLRHTDLVLPGKDGLDLDLSRFYNSNMAEIGTRNVLVYETDNNTNTVANAQGWKLFLYDKNNACSLDGIYDNIDAATIKGEEVLQNNTNITTYGLFQFSMTIGTIYNTIQFLNYNDCEQEDSYFRSRYDLGVGWSFGFPSIQERMENGTSIPTEYLTYHDGKGNAWDINLTSDTSDSNLVNYQGKDMVVDLASTLGKSYTNGVDQAYYVCIEQGQKEDYFAMDGRLIGIKDRLGNEIKFNYLTRTVNGIQNSYIQQITDSVRRIITFNYVDNADGSGQINITVNDPNNTKSLTLHYVKDTFTYTYTKCNWAWSSTLQRNDITSEASGYTRTEPRLQAYIDPNNETTAYSYANNNVTFSYNWSNASYWKSNTMPKLGRDMMCLLTKVQYPQSSTYYEYKSQSRVLGSEIGAYGDYVIKKRYDTQLKSQNGSTVESGILNQADYTYNGDITYKYFHQNRDYGSTSVVNGLTTQYTYSEKGQQKTINATDGIKTRNIQNTAWDTNFTLKPTQTLTTDSETSGTSVTVTTNNTYNSWGGLETTTDVGSPSSAMTAHKVKYYYTDTNNKFQLTNKQWNQNETDTTPQNEYYQYDSLGQVTSYTNANNEVANYSYNRSNGIKVTQVTKALENGKTAKTVETCGTASKGAYPTEIKQYYTNAANSYVTTTNTKTYDMLLGLVSSVTDDSGNQTTYTYDNLGRLTYTKLPDVNNCTVEQFISYTPGVTSDQFDTTNQGLLTTLVNSYIKYKDKTSGIEHRYSQHKSYYDCYGNLVLDLLYDDSKAAWVPQQQYHYDNFGRPIYVKDAMGNVTTCEYDAWDNATRVVDPHGNSYYEAITYPNNSWMKSDYMIASGSSTREFQVDTYYDQWGRVIKKVAQPSGYYETYSYDISGNLIQYTDPKNNVYQYTYDSMNQLTDVKDPTNQDTKYTHTMLGDLRTSSIADIWTTTKSYDELGQLIASTDPGGRSDIYVVNNLGQVVQSTDPSNNNFTYAYDSHGRLTAKTCGTLNIQYQYGQHPFGCDTITASNGTSLGYTYNTLGQVTATAVNNGTTTAQVGYQYDDLGRTTSEQGPSLTTGYSYDKDWLQTVQINGAVATYEYYPNGTIKSVTYPTLSNGSVLKTTYEYDSLGQLTKLTNLKDSTALTQYQYVYDHNGNITSTTEQIGTAAATTTAYEYDSLNRLTKITRPSGSVITYTYDARGNRITSNGDTPISTVSASFTYNALDELTQYSTGTATTSYVYGPNGQRLKKTTSTGTTCYVYDTSDRLIAETNGSNQTTASYAWGPDQVLAKKDQNGNIYYYLYNGHGDVTEIIDNAGNVVNSYTYDEWGNALSAQEQTSNPFRYADACYDQESGLYYLNARYYDPVAGRFTSEDSNEGSITNPLSLNLYTYVENNPINYIDPSGCVMQGDKEKYGVNSSTYKALISLGDKWNSAKTQAERDSIHSQADAIRANANSSGSKSPSSGSSRSWDNRKEEFDFYLGMVSGVGGVEAHTASALEEVSLVAFKAADNVSDFLVSNKHLMDAGGKWQKFATTSKGQVNKWLQEGLRSNNVQFLPNNQEGSYKVIINLGKIIGTKGETKIRVIIGADGKIWTAFPVK